MPTFDELRAQFKVVYLSETYPGTWLSPEHYDTVVLPVLTPHGPVNTHNQVHLHMDRHPALRRKYLPSKSFSLQHPAVKETVIWVAMDLDFYMWKRFTRELKPSHPAGPGDYYCSSRR